MGSAPRVKVAHGRLVMVWWRVRSGHATAERHLDALAAAARAHGWSHLKPFVESPPLLWVFPEDAEHLAVSVTAERAGGRWFFRVSGEMRYPSDGPQRVAGVLSDVLWDRSCRVRR
ncbi:hypothetical protein GWI34_00870 [Actinomadura sp. DSM 109109]|nr:hypothetical protein [Actinomadura lepetitiana]